MQHFVIGTAGHIDHGKTSLVKAITTIDCDTHPEEKKRGITINLGFAYTQIENNQYLAFVDVPGHHRFIRNMISGASGIDFLMLIIAADDGIMPQTLEHFKICSLLGINKGVVVINKVDLVDEERLNKVKADIENLIKDSFLQNAKVLPVSAITGDGIEALKSHLLSQNVKQEASAHSEKFRMYIDRSFNVDGFGTVVTGTVTDGLVKNEDSLIHLPSEKEFRVRQIQRHEKNVDEALKGTRAALNVTGAKKTDLKMGDLLVKSQLIKTQRLDAKITLLDDIKTIKRRFDALLYCGTYKTIAKIRILDTETLSSNESALVQIDLPLPWYYHVGENFILRNTSSDKTIGGGFVIDPTPLHHKKKNPELLKELQSLVKNPKAYINFKIRQSPKMLGLNFFEQALQWDSAQLKLFIEKEDQFKILTDEKAKAFIILKSLSAKIETKLIDTLNHHQSNVAIDKNGVTKDVLKGFIENLLPYFDMPENQKLFDTICLDLENSKKLFRNNNLWSAKAVDWVKDAEEDKDLVAIEKAILNEGVTSVGEKRIIEFGEALSIPFKKTKVIIKQLSDQQRIKRFEKYYIHKNHINLGREKITHHFKDSAAGLTVADFRDLIGGNRRIALYLFELFEKEGMVYRDGDFRREV